MAPSWRRGCGCPSCAAAAGSTGAPWRWRCCRTARATAARRWTRSCGPTSPATASRACAWTAAAPATAAASLTTNTAPCSSPMRARWWSGRLRSRGAAATCSRWAAPGAASPRCRWRPRGIPRWWAPWQCAPPMRGTRTTCTTRAAACCPRTCPGAPGSCTCSASRRTQPRWDPPHSPAPGASSGWRACRRWSRWRPSGCATPRVTTRTGRSAARARTRATSASRCSCWAAPTRAATSIRSLRWRRRAPRRRRSPRSWARGATTTRTSAQTAPRWASCSCCCAGCRSSCPLPTSSGSRPPSPPRRRRASPPSWRARLRGSRPPASPARRRRASGWRPAAWRSWRRWRQRRACRCCRAAASATRVPTTTQPSRTLARWLSLARALRPPRRWRRARTTLPP
mmetsp:Transcript_43448/g.112505  ORF Transcript_43448/g.112505 Transcript_43448/m.112505 type:complete len:399 (-) Transcript_43448:1203-2399(-)